MPTINDGPEADGHSVLDGHDGDDDETSALRPLFPDGDPSTETQWRELWKDPQS